MKTSFSWFSLGTIVLALVVLFFVWRGDKSTTSYTALQHEVSILKNQLAKARWRFDEKEKAVSSSAKPVNNVPSLPVAPVSKDDQFEFDTKRALAEDLARTGKMSEAIHELVSCLSFSWRFKDGDVKRFMLSRTLMNWAQSSAEAAAALKSLRDSMETSTVGSGGHREYLELSRLNWLLGENVRNLELIRGLPEGDKRREAVAATSFDYLLSERLYTEAASARSMSGFAYELDSLEKKAAKSGGTTQFDVERIATYIEVMAGAGRQADARWLAERLFRIDGSNVAKEAVIRRLSRAGHTIESLSTPR